MATPAEITERIDGDIEAIEDMVAELNDVARDWAELPESVLVAWCLDWDQAMGTILPSLAQASAESNMSSAQRARYQAVLVQLRRAMPIVERLDLYRPPVPIDL